MKCFRDASFAKFGRIFWPCCAGLLLVPAIVIGACATSPWRNAESGSAIESALYRWMPMPVSKVFGLRPPREATPLLSELIQRKPSTELYSLRALNEEAALDFAAAEADWKKYTEVSPDRIQAEWSMADFYKRRLRPADEIAALTSIGRAPAPPSEKLTPVENQRSWRAFERIFQVIAANALPADTSAQSYRAWLDRYPAQAAVYGRYFQFLLDHRSFADAEKLIAQYHASAPADEVLPVKLRALLEYKRGSIERGLAIYDNHFQPLWPQELMDGYFALMTETRSLRRYLDQAQSAVERNPDDLNAAARIFYYYQRQGRTDAAQQALTRFRVRKEQRNAKWTSQELYILAKLSEGIRNYPEAARYYYALFSTNDKADAQQLALAGLVNVLLDAPEQDVRVGSGDLSMYRDIGGMDRGPGFLNGILSLVMNSTSPAYAYSQEEQHAVPYFHRAEAAQLIHLFDDRFPNSPHRAGLRARLIQTYAVYGESGAVIRDGRQFLAAFPNDPEREPVGLLLANAYARENRTQEEFALYDEELADLARRADNIPLGIKSSDAPVPSREIQPSDAEPDSALSDAEASQSDAPSVGSRAFSTQAAAAVQAPKSAQAWYSDYLERYLSRLASMHQLPQALAVLRREIDRNPNDPGLYERLAQFLDQNRLGQQQEQVYERAIQQFPDRSWYHKLARFYLRQKRDADFSRLSEQVVKIFSGTELDEYFSDVVSGAQYYARLNEFAHARFPHDLLFVRNLMNAYQKTQADQWESLLREHWWEAEDLRDRYFEYLSRTGRLEQELAALQKSETAAQTVRWSDLASSNPVAVRFIGEAGFWRSHFEEAAPVMNALAEQYPADVELGRRASAVYRSLAAFDPRNTEVAIKIEENLYLADPGNRDTLARIGDILADRELFDRASPYWQRIAQVRPGEPQAYLDAATIYCDYYDFDSALKLLEEGRAKFGDPALYAYEAGAIYENKREFPQAIAEYIKGALKQHEGSRPHNRLLDLARRKSLREEIDRATAPLTEGAAPAIDAIKLHVAVLETQNRPKDVEQLLAAIGDRTTSLETLEWLERIARQKSLEKVQEKVLEKQAAVTTDPVRKLELRYSLVRFYEAMQNLQQAQRNVESLYRENPKILGVVRSTADFYWQNKDRQRAIEVLVRAADDSYPALGAQFRLEAARKASESGQYEQTRRLLTQLLSAALFNEEYLAAMADTFSKAGDDKGLKQFSLGKIEEIGKSQLPQDVRTRQIAALRRGMIPALTRLKDFVGAVDQYIEVINRYPEDDALVSEAAFYAQRNGRQQQLLGYYANTIQQSPRDYRWPMVLARIQTQVEDYPAAVETYATAVRIRPDRTDLRSTRAELLERLMRFDESAAEYQQLFDLNYHDTRWMEKVAEIRARQGNSAATIAALNTAFVENRAEKPANFFSVATRLVGWGMLQQARDFAQKGVDSAGRDLLAVADNHNGARIYVEVMTRLRQQDAAYSRLQLAVSDATSLRAEAAIVVKQVEKNGIASVTDQQWRNHAIEVRCATAGTGMQAAMQAMGKSAGNYFTPEEKLQFSFWLDERASKAGNDELATVFLPAAEAAVLPDLQARWLKQLMLSGNASGGYKSRLVQLQTSRLQFGELGAALEAHAKQLTPQQGRTDVLVDASNTYRSGALYDAEFAVLRAIGLQSSAQVRQRYFELLLQRRSQELVQLAGSSRKEISDAACQYVLAHGLAELAQQAIAARGRAFEPVWTKAYSALTGLYFADRTPAMNAAFLNTLGDRTIGERLGKPVDRSQQLAGNTWFYYGSRYGEWLGAAHADDPEDFLPAQLEQSPVSASGYIALAEYYADAGKIDRAIDDYKRTLELAPDRADIHDRIAVLYWRQQKRREAMDEWKKALELLDAQVHQRVVPPAFWPTFGYVMNHIGNHHIASELRPQSDAVLRDYVRQNGTYQVDELLRSAYVAIGDPQAGVAFLLELASIAPEPNSVLELLVDVNWIPAKMRNPIYDQILLHLQDRLRNITGISRQYGEENIRSWQSRYAMHLVGLHEFDHAAAVLQPQREPSARELEIRYRIALANRQFDAILDQYRANAESAPKAENLRTVAAALQKADQRPAARKLLEFLFMQEISAHRLNSANMLGLAEIRLQDGDASGAMDVLRRLVLVVGQPFENLDSAATLLARNGRHAEAVEFLGRLAKAEPWNQDARLHLAQEQIAANQDAAGARSLATAVATDAQAAYPDRIAAATILAGSGGPELGSRELNVIAHGTGSADRPYFFAARLNAAKNSTDAALSARLLQSALADAPERNTTRLPLFYALTTLRQDRLAISEIEPLLRNNYLNNRYGGRSRSYDQNAEPDDPTSAASDAVTDEPLDGREPNEALPADRVALAIAVAKSYANLGALENSLSYYRMALSGTVSAMQRAEATKNITNLRAAIRRNANNVQRMPVIHQELDQNHLVRSRLVAMQKSPPSAGSGRSAKSGDAQ